jgi:hypothetical protein
MQLRIPPLCDDTGFTAWSSMREPTQVLLLLECIYRAFDEIAKRRKVFKGMMVVTMSSSVE